MSDFADHTTKAERDARKERAIARTSGRRGADGLTDAERALLDGLRRSGYALAHGYIRDERRGAAYYHLRLVEPAL
jgi:hypothetical protein